MVAVPAGSIPGGLGQPWRTVRYHVDTCRLHTRRPLGVRHCVCSTLRVLDTAISPPSKRQGGTHRRPLGTPYLREGTRKTHRRPLGRPLGPTRCPQAELGWASPFIGRPLRCLRAELGWASPFIGCLVRCLRAGVSLARRAALAASAVQVTACQGHLCGDWKNSPTAGIGRIHPHPAIARLAPEEAYSPS